METKDGFIIRPIKETDNAQMARLIRCVIDEFGVSRTGTVYDDPVTDCISQSVENVNTEYWVIDYGGEIQGGCGFYPTKGLPGKCAEIVKYYLSPAAREKGLGGMILDLIVRRAKEAGYTSLYIKHSLRLVKPLICIRNGDFSCWMVNSEIPGIRQPVYSC